MRIAMLIRDHEYGKHHVVQRTRTNDQLQRKLL